MLTQILGDVSNVIILMLSSCHQISLMGGTYDLGKRFLFHLQDTVKYFPEKYALNSQRACKHQWKECIFVFTVCTAYLCNNTLYFPFQLLLHSFIHKVVHKSPPHIRTHVCMKATREWPGFIPVMVSGSFISCSLMINAKSPGISSPGTFIKSNVSF